MKLDEDEHVTGIRGLFHQGEIPVSLLFFIKKDGLSSFVCSSVMPAREDGISQLSGFGSVALYTCHYAAGEGGFYAQ